MPDPYEGKIAYFDAQTETPWASKEFGPEETAKLKRLKVELGPLEGKAVLEPGCGTGRLTEVLSGWVGPRGRVTALDISANMIDRAKRRLAGLSNVTVLRAALEDLDLDPASFDVILHHQVFPHYHDKAQALDISVRAVKPGGRVIVFHFINTARINDTHRKAGTAVERDAMPPENELGRLFAAAGLTINFLIDDAEGFFLSARRPERGRP